MRFCHSPEGKFANTPSLKSHPQCRIGVLKWKKLSSSEDIAFIETSKIPPGLKAAELNLNPQFAENDVVYAAGYGAGEGQNKVAIVPTTQEEKDTWRAERDACLELKKRCEEASTQCTKEEDSDLGKCIESGPLSEEDSEPPALKDIGKWKHLRGGFMKISSLQGESFSSDGFLIESYVVATKTADGAPQSSGGDSGSSWWHKGRMVGVHFAGKSKEGGDTSLFRTLKQYNETLNGEVTTPEE